MGYYFALHTYCDDLEVDWVEEFIDYHSVVGASHFIISYTQQNPEKGFKIFEPYIKKGLLTVNYKPQAHCYDNWQDYHLIARDKGVELGCRWLGFIDLDEFILPRAKDTIPEILQEYEEFSGLALSWHIFGTSGLLTRPHSQIRCLLHRAEKDFLDNTHIKCIVDPTKLTSFRTTHLANLTDGKLVNEDKEQVTYHNSRICDSKIIINHYVIRSLQDFNEVDSIAIGYKNKPYFDRLNRNEVFDDEISVRFADKVDAFHKSIHE